MSIINLQIALEALESGNFQFGIESLEASAKNGTNAAALYNLGICYERGIGVEQDRAKVNNFISNLINKILIFRHVIIIVKHLL
jgi:TPR repeat protein